MTTKHQRLLALEAKSRHSGAETTWQRRVRLDNTVIVRVPVDADAAKISAINETTAKMGKHLATYVWEGPCYDGEILPDYYALHAFDEAPESYGVHICRDAGLLSR